MSLPRSIDLIPFHEPLWTRFEPIFQSGRIAHAFLLIGPMHANIMAFANRFMARLLCLHDGAPCGGCQPCRMLIQAAHPDLHYVLQDAPGSAIKIDQIRALQHDVYQTPLCGARRFIIISPADKLNGAAANALLKILEEPPTHTTFILIAEQTGSLPLTIMSRCQQYHVLPPESCDSSGEIDYFKIGHFYDEQSPKGSLFLQRSDLLTQLCDLVNGKSTPTTLAAGWSDYALSDIVWFLYLVTMQAIQYRLLGHNSTNPNEASMVVLSQAIRPELLFLQLDKMNELSRKIQQNITLNQALALESLLLGYL